MESRGVKPGSWVGTGKPGPGRPKGSPNKATALLKDQILEAGAKAHPEGMVGFLVQQAQENPSAFMTLLGRIIPMQIQGDPEAPLQVEHDIAPAAQLVLERINAIAERSGKTGDPAA